MCEAPETTTQALVSHIAMRNSQVRTEQDATQYSGLTGDSQHRVQSQTAQLHNNGPTLPWHPTAAHGCLHLDYYLPMLSPNEGYNETGLTMQSAGPIREPWQPNCIRISFQRQ